jgi:hypothetical protein
VHFENNNIFFYTEKMFYLTPYSAGVVAVNSKVVELASELSGTCLTIIFG